jgi:hypothetical protein
LSTPDARRPVARRDGGACPRDVAGSIIQRVVRVPARRPIKPIYVTKFVELIDGA